jgi:hypothetical protein
MSQETKHLSVDQSKEEWQLAFESQFPDLTDRPFAQTCFREGWARSEARFAERHRMHYGTINPFVGLKTVRLEKCELNEYMACRAVRSKFCRTNICP